ncbi:MAG: hypothetical protein IJY65_03150 [Clostridia bacterium]|nr:hypothetical protein [Clostridia bacterium]
MNKIKIENFALHVCGKDLVCRAPFSLYEVMLDSLHSFEADFCEFFSVFTVDSAVATSRELYIRCSGVPKGATVSLNGNPVSISIGSAKDILHNVKQYIKHGDNTLSVSFRSPGGVLDPRRIGVFGEIELLAFESSVIESVKINRAYKGTGATVDISVSVVGRTDNTHAVAVLAAPSGKMYYSGLSRCRGRISIPDAELWYPCGVGNSPLYKLTVTLYQGDELADVFETRIGLCSLELQKNGARTSLLANGVECLLIGAELDDIDAVFNSSYTRIQRLLESAYAAGVNALRIRGEFTPSKKLYECADRYGILIFREVSGLSSLGSDERACGMIAMTETLEELSAYTSFAFAVTGAEDYSMVDRLISGNDIGVKHLEDSFFNGCIEKINLPISIPRKETLATYGEDGMLNLFSVALEGAVKDRRELIEMLSSISESYLCPSDFSDAIYTSQINAASRLKDAFAAIRKENTAPFAIFVGRLFDQTPKISDSLIDSFLRPKAAYHALARSAKPIFASAEIKGGSLTVTVRSDRSDSYSAVLRVLVKDSANRTHREKSVDFTLRPHTASEFYNENIDELLGAEKDRFYIYYEVLDGTRVEFCDTKQLVSPRCFKYEDPNIQTHIEGAGRRFSLTLISSAYAAGVSLSFEGVDAVFEDNFFDITENVPQRVRFSVIGDHFGIDELGARLVVRTVRDIGRAASCQKYKK